MVVVQRYLGKLGQLINVQGRPSDKHRAALTSVIQARVRPLH